MGSSININSYNRRDSFGLGWADQWDYKFNDEKLKANSNRNSNNGTNSSHNYSRFSGNSSNTSSNDSSYGLSIHGTTIARPSKFGKENSGNPNLAGQRSSSSSSSSKPPKNPLNALSSKKISDLNKKVINVANSSAVMAKSAANSSAHKVKSGTSMGIKWLKKQYSLKTLKDDLKTLKLEPKKKQSFRF